MVGQPKIKNRAIVDLLLTALHCIFHDKIKICLFIIRSFKLYFLLPHPHISMRTFYINKTIFLTTN